MTYELVNDAYGNERVEVTIDELRDLLRNVFGDTETELEERTDGIYEVGGELVAEAVPEPVKLSAMTEGDRAYHAGLGTVVELRSGGLAGGAKHDLYLATVCDITEWDGDDLPNLIIDTDNVN